MDVRNQVSSSCTRSASCRNNGVSRVQNPTYPPPSYNEAVSTSNAQMIQSSMPDALHLYVQNVGRFSAWDDRATRILIINRLDMNERFTKARNPLERRLLWNTILNHLLSSGYRFELIDLIQFWELQFYIYKSIINDLAAEINTNLNWKYLERMDKVFKYSNEVPRPKSVVTLFSVSDLYREIVPDSPLLPSSHGENSDVPTSLQRRSPEHRRHYTTGSSATTSRTNDHSNKCFLS